MRSERGETSALVVTADERLCGIPTRYVAETMRPLPIEPLSGMPAFIVGVSIVRGIVVPVANLRALLGLTETKPPSRIVTLRLGDRFAALAVDSVVGMRRVEKFSALPPLLGGCAQDVVDSVGVLDAQLLFVLEAARLVPDSAWASIDASGPE